MHIYTGRQSRVTILQSKVYEAQQVLLNSGKPIMADSIRNVLLGSEDRPKMIMEVFKEHNDEMLALIGKDFTIALRKEWMDRS